MPAVDGPCDPWDDASVCRFVGPDEQLSDPRYEPGDLVAATGAHMRTGKVILLRQTAAQALAAMADAHFRDLGRPISVISGYRSYAYQKGIKDRGCPDALCAQAGRSEHQTGLAVDLFAATTEREFLAVPDYAASHAWLRAHAHAYGFTESYRNGRAVDGYENEPWHWRYVGKELAAKLRDAGQTLTQWARAARAGNGAP